MKLLEGAFAPFFITYLESFISGLFYLLLILTGARVFPGANIISATKAHWQRLKEEINKLPMDIMYAKYDQEKEKEKFNLLSIEIERLKEKCENINNSINSFGNAILWRGWAENELWRLMHTIQIKMLYIKLLIKEKEKDYAYILEELHTALIGIKDLETNEDFKEYKEELKEWKENLEELIKFINIQFYLAKLKQMLKNDEEKLQKLQKIEQCPTEKDLEELNELLKNAEKPEVKALIECIKRDCQKCQTNRKPSEALKHFYKDYYTMVDNYYLSLTKDFNRNLFLSILGIFISTVIMVCFELMLPESKNISAPFVWFLGLGGGLLSRYKIILEHKKLPSDYGLSWSVVMLAPTAGGLFALLGVLMVQALGNIGILGQEFTEVLKKPQVAYGLAVVLGYSGKFFTKAVEIAEEKVEGVKK